MSAPDTNIQTQKRQHRGPLAGMQVVVAFALILLMVFVGWIWFQSDGPEGAEFQIDGRTGAIVETN
jgi:hypothetical protein